MKFGTALKLARAGFNVTRDGFNEEYLFANGVEGMPEYVCNAGSGVIDWHDIGDEDTLKYDDLDADNWRVIGPLTFDQALTAMMLGCRVRRESWEGYRHLQYQRVENTQNGTHRYEFFEESRSGDSCGVSTPGKLPICSLDTYDMRAKDWMVWGNYPNKETPE